MEETRNIFEQLKSSAFDIGKESSLEPGQSIGDYRIICSLSLTGFAELYLAVNTLTKKPYALKLIPPLLTTLDPDFEERFAKAKAEMDKQHTHHGICYIHESGVSDGYYYIVTDYVETVKGRTYTLHDRLERKVRFTRDKIKRLSLQLCNSLEYAHHNVAGPLVHSNLKPSNILFDKQNNPILTDFKELYIIGYPYFIDIVKDALHCNIPLPENMEGTASVSASGSGSRRMLSISRSFSLAMDATQLSVLHRRPRHSMTGIFRFFKGMAKLGCRPKLSPYEFVHNQTNKILNYSPVMESYDYMSPEQKAGEAPTEKSNIYSAGLIIYNLLTGTRISGNWNLPSSFGCSRAWDSVIFRCLQFSPEDRYSNFTELKEAVGSIDEKKNYFYPVSIVASVMVLVTLLLVFSFNFADNENESYFIRFKRGISSIFDPSLKSNKNISMMKVNVKVEPANSEIILKSEENGKESHFVISGNTAEIMIEPGAYVALVSKNGYSPVRKEFLANPLSDSFSAHLQKVQVFKVKEYRQSDDKFPKAGFLWTVPDSGIEMIPVESGNAVPYNFWMGKTEITQQQYESVMWKNPSYFKGEETLPVNSISWHGAMEFCRRLTMKEHEANRLPPGFIYRLPLESEWEYCARAGSREAYFFGDDPDVSSDYLWCEKNSEQQPHRAAALKPNPWGFHDMLGNMAEWCLDSSQDRKSPDLIVRDGLKSQPAAYMLRGGSFLSLAVNTKCSSSEKIDAPDAVENRIGFRITLAPEKPSK